MHSLACYLILLFSTPLIVLILHAFIVRVIQNPFHINLSPILVAAFAVIVGYIVLTELSWIIILRNLPSFSEKFWTGVYGFFVYSGLAFSYFQLFAMSETARRIHILTELHLKGNLPLDEITNWYDPKLMVSLRLERLVAWKQLILMGDNYRIKKRLMLRIAKLMRAWARVLRFDHKNSL